MAMMEALRARRSTWRPRQAAPPRLPTALLPTPGVRRPLPFCVRMLSPLVRSPKTARGPSMAAMSAPCGAACSGHSLHRARPAAEWPPGRGAPRDPPPAAGTPGGGAGPSPAWPIAGRGAAQPRAAIGPRGGTKAAGGGRGGGGFQDLLEGEGRGAALAHARWLLAAPPLRGRVTAAGGGRSSPA